MGAKRMFGKAMNSVVDIAKPGDNDVSVESLDMFTQMLSAAMTKKRRPDGSSYTKPSREARKKKNRKRKKK